MKAIKYNQETLGGRCVNGLDTHACAVILSFASGLYFYCFMLEAYEQCASRLYPLSYCNMSRP